MVDLCILVTTYGRPERLRMLLDDINQQACGLSLSVNIRLDGHLDEMPDYKDIDIRHYMRIHGQEHLGKSGYWQTIMSLWDMSKGIDSRWYLQIQDDTRLTSGALCRMIATWEAIDAPNKIALNPLVDTARSKVYPGQTMQFGEHTVVKRQWIDCMFFCERLLFDVLEWRVDPPGRIPTGTTGSGVGPQICRRLLHKGYSLWQTTESLITHGAHKSLMHYHNQQKGLLVTSEPITAGFFLDRTVPQEQVSRLLTTVQPQVDMVYVYWYGPGSPPAFLANKRHITVFDDGEMHLPPSGYFVKVKPECTYAKNMVAMALMEVEAWNRAKCVVGKHPGEPEVAMHMAYLDIADDVTAMRNDSQMVRMSGE